MKALGCYSGPAGLEGGVWASGSGGSGLECRRPPGVESTVQPVTVQRPALSHQYITASNSSAAGPATPAGNR